MANKINNVVFSLDCVASDLLDSHALGNKLEEPEMERALSDGNSVDVSVTLLLNLYAQIVLKSKYVSTALLNWQSNDLYYLVTDRRNNRVARHGIHEHLGDFTLL